MGSDTHTPRERLAELQQRIENAREHENLKRMEHQWAHATVNDLASQAVRLRRQIDAERFVRVPA